MNFLQFDMEKQKNYFSWYGKLPLIGSILIAISFCAFGIIMDNIFKASVVGGQAVGEQAVSSSFALPLFAIVGCLIAVAAYFILKVICSYKILTIYYLQNLHNINLSTAKQAANRNGNGTNK